MSLENSKEDYNSYIYYTIGFIIIAIIIVIYFYYGENEYFTSVNNQMTDICHFINKTNTDNTSYLIFNENNKLEAQIDDKEITYSTNNSISDGDLVYKTNIVSIQGDSDYSSNLYKIIPNALKCLPGIDSFYCILKTHTSGFIDIPQSYKIKTLYNNSCEFASIFTGSENRTYDSYGGLGFTEGKIPEYIFRPNVQSFNWIDNIIRNENRKRIGQGDIIDGQIDLIDFRRLIYNDNKKEIEIGHKLASLAKITNTINPVQYNHELELVIPKDCFIVFYAHQRTVYYSNYDQDTPVDILNQYEIEYLTRDQVHYLEDEMVNNQNLNYGVIMDITKSSPQPGDYENYFIDKENNTPDPILARTKIVTANGDEIDLTDRKLRKVRYDKFVPYVVNFSFLKAYSDGRDDNDNTVANKVLSSFGTFKPNHLYQNSSNINEINFGKKDPNSSEYDGNIFGTGNILDSTDPISICNDERFTVMTLRELENLLGCFPSNNNYITPSENSSAPLGRINDNNNENFLSHMTSDRVTGIKIYNIIDGNENTVCNFGNCPESTEDDPKPKTDYNGTNCTDIAPAPGNDVGLPAGTPIEAAYVGGAEGVSDYFDNLLTNFTF